MRRESGASPRTRSQPSSLIRAVSSETLSVTQYDSMPASLRKSQAAWEAWPAPPPEPPKKRRPPRSRVARERLDDGVDMGVVDLFEDLRLSSRNERENEVNRRHSTTTTSCRHGSGLPAAFWARQGGRCARVSVVIR